MLGPDGSARRGSDVYDDPEALAAYLAHRHSGTASPNVVMEEPAFLAALGDVGGARVLDLGCGDGATAPLLLDRGATSYVGLDASSAMVERANRDHGGPAARFEVGAIEDLDVGAGPFEVAVSRLALHHVEDLGAALGRIRQVLAPGGRLVFSVTHPVITSSVGEPTGRRTTWTVDRYFEPGPRPRPWFGGTVTWHHRTVEAHVTALLAAGFRLDVLSECEPRADLLAAVPDELTRRRRVPLLLLLAGTAT